MRLIPISKNLDINTSYAPHSNDYTFAKNISIAPALLAELPQLITSYTLCFLKKEDSYELVVLTGDTNTNCYINPKGIWLCEIIPAHFKSYPFFIAKDKNSNLVLSIDEEALQKAEDSQSIFSSEHNLTPEVQKTAEFLQSCHSNKLQTKKAVDALAKHELFTPFEIEIVDAEKKTLQGIYAIDEEKLNTLEADTLKELRDNSALTVAYAQLFSRANESQLSKRLQYIQTQEPKKDKIDLDNFFSENNSISFT
ncbi:hypothetical protein M947_11390 [Sulfurimonas hongkongensis]|uniref:SapC family protein n=1 Tax=Sulfurimonas hongkongensis TaxID=1172190 RepID=T0KCA2_9BACT|nr:SapC family protein [Sulfurimonas hongkongensis]EQB34364.1 hypothetical protein M947_11390 [Sulfurimonas hongkongensis]